MDTRNLENLQHNNEPAQNEVKAFVPNVTSSTPEPVSINIAQTARFQEVWVDAQKHIISKREYQPSHYISDENETIKDKAMVGFEDSMTMLRKFCRSQTAMLSYETINNNNINYCLVETDDNGIVHHAIRQDGTHEFPLGIIASHLFLKSGNNLFELTVSEDGNNLIIRKKT